MSEAKEFKESELLRGFILTLVGVVILLFAPFFVLPTLIFFGLFIGIGLSIVGVAITGWFIGKILDEEAAQKKSLKKARRGAIWIWAVCLLSIVVLAFAWFTLTWPAFVLIETIEGAYTFPPETQPAINLIKTVMGWFLILMTLGLLLWAYVMSQRREEVTYPY